MGWDQAQDVTRIIQDSLTTTKRPKKGRKEEEEEYEDYEEYEEEYEYEEETEELRERPRSQRPRPKKPLRQRPTSSEERDDRRGNRKHLRKQEEEIYEEEDEEYDLDVKRPSRPKFRQTSKTTSRPRPKRPTRPTRRPRTTTEAPVEYEDYLDYDEYELELEEENLADELVEGLVEGIEEELAEELEEEEDQVPKVKLFPARGSNLRTSSNSRSQPASRSEGRPVASVGPRLPPRFGRPRPPSVSTASQAASQRSQASASGKQADFTVTGKADENRRTTSNVLRQPDSTEKPARQQQPKVVATSNSRPKKVFSEQNEKSKDLLHQLLNSGKSKKQQVDEKLSQFEATEAVPSSSSRTDPRRLFGGGRRRKKKPFPRPQAASTEEPREQPQLKSANEKKKDEAVRKNDLARPQPSSAPVLKEPAVKQKEALRLENANEIRRSQGTENNKEVEKSTKSSVSFSVSASKSSLSDSSKEMLQAALNNLHKIAGDKKKEKEASQSAGPATKTEAKVDSSEVVDLRAGAPPSRPRFLNPTSLGEKKTGTPRPSRPQKSQSSARPQRPQGSGRPSRPQGFGRPSRPQSPSRPSRPESSGRSSTRGQVPPRPQNSETEVEEVATTPRTISVRTKQPRPSFNRGRPPTRPAVQ